MNVGVFPDWHKNQLSGEKVPGNIHWSKISEFSFGDIKGVWELSRFSWAFALSRAFAQSHDEKYAEHFWQLFEHWLSKNPPNAGPNWMCGQEATFRLIAVVFAFDVLSSSTASKPPRAAQFGGFVLATGRRIYRNIDYALSQSNNHGISECVGLITAAVILPKEKESLIWMKLGLRELCKQLRDLVYDDGGFAQHSAIYHRVVVHDLLWCIVVLRATQNVEPDWLIDAADRALKFVQTITDDISGRPPLYGANDGANILPLADADFLDFRPTIQAAYALLYHRRRLHPGPWDEMADWLAGGANRESVIVKPTNRTYTGVKCSERPEWRAAHFSDAGCLVLSVGDLRVFFRCPTRFRHRPAQADLLHIDVSWRGESIAHDGGSFSYNSGATLMEALASARSHNTITIDGLEPMRKVSRFLYLPWPHGTVNWGETGAEILAEHDAWHGAGVRHVRGLTSPENATIVVTDRVQGVGSHRVSVHWLLADNPYSVESNRVVLHTRRGRFAIEWSGNCQISVVRADRQSGRGWWSPYYGYAEPAVSLRLDFDFTSEILITTRLYPVSHGN